MIVSGSATTRCGCGIWPAANPSANPSGVTPARCKRWRVGELEGQPVIVSGSDDHTVRAWDLMLSSFVAGASFKDCVFEQPLPS